MMKNIVLVTVDSLRADYVHGAHQPASLATLDRLKHEGTYFTNAFSNAAYTKASFLSIMSGTYPWMFESVGSGYGTNRPHVAELLSSAGYTTAGFHTNTYLSPTYGYDRGFDHYLGRDHESGSLADPSGREVTFRGALEKALATEGVADAIHWVYRTTGRQLGIQLGSQLYRPAEQLNDAVVAWTARTDGPRFVWVHYMDVHNPYYPHEGTVSEGMSRRQAIKLFHKANELGEATPAADVAVLERLYRGEIEYLDAQLGDLLVRLDETLGMENTLVAFTSDHGEAFQEHGGVFHQGSKLYDENVHIPLLLWGSDVTGGQIHTPVSNADLVPTLLTAAGVEPPASAVGTDLLALTDDPRAERLVFAEAYNPEDGNLMVTDGRYKLIRNLETGEELLFDRQADPDERDDITAVAPAVTERLAAALDDHLVSIGEHATERQHLEVGEDVRLQLRRLGYDE